MRYNFPKEILCKRCLFQFAKTRSLALYTAIFRPEENKTLTLSSNVFSDGKAYFWGGSAKVVATSPKHLNPIGAIIFQKVTSELFQTCWKAIGCTVAFFTMASTKIVEKVGYAFPLAMTSPSLHMA